MIHMKMIPVLLLLLHNSQPSTGVDVRRRQQQHTTAPSFPASSSTLLPSPPLSGLTQSWSGVYGTNAINPHTSSSSATLAHAASSANGNGIGLMPPLLPTAVDPAPVRPIGLDLHIEATMKIHDPIRRDALHPFTPQMNTQLPKYRFDVVERNNTVVVYGENQDGTTVVPSLSNPELVR